MCRQPVSLASWAKKRTCDPTGALPTCPIKPAGVMRFDWVTRISINNLRPLLSLFSADLSIDLGTTNTRVYSRAGGIVVNEPSAVALDDRTGEVQALGKEAKEMLGRTPAHIRVVRPLKNGVIADFKVTEKMLSYFIQKAQQRRTLVHPRILISVPSEITQVEKRAVAESATEVIPTGKPSFGWWALLLTTAIPFAGSANEKLRTDSGTW